MNTRCYPGTADRGPLTINREPGTGDYRPKTAHISGARSGQLFSSDIAVATMVFIFCLSLAFLAWNTQTEQINRSERLRELQKTVASTVESLIRSPGVPEDWDTNWDVEVPGLATEDRFINSTKASAFIDMMNATYYDDYRHVMGLGEYRFYMEVANLSGSVVTVDGKDFVAGEEPTDYEESLSVMRTAIYDGEFVRVNFIIWK